VPDPLARQDCTPERRDRPLISVVVPSVSGFATLRGCLEALARQEGDVCAEVLVVDRCGEPTRAAVAARFPGVRVIPAPSGAPIPALRALGAEQARGQVVAFLEDGCAPGPRWLRAIVGARAAGHLAVGGPVANGATRRAADWARFFCEYARFMPPVPRGAVPGVAGNNSAYDRALFGRLVPGLRAGLWEPFLQARLREAVSFHSEPDMAVAVRKSCGLGRFLAQRFHYSRAFAAMRLGGRPWPARLAYACACAGLPALLLGRLLRLMLRKQRHVGPFLLALPLLGVFLAVWAAGEAVGALCGPGQSAGRVE
jgi:glycosyltransferase involved in cell wall biosynthesis